MYNVYISRYQNGNSIVNTEKLMFSVPGENGFPIKKPVVKADEDAAETFSFTMESNSPYYDALLQLKTMIRVVYQRDENDTADVIFYGRVLSINDSTIYNTRNVKCEGYFAFLNDSYYEGVPEKNLGKISPSTYFSKIINNHNDYIPSKSINRGTVGFTLPTKTDKYEPTAWTQSSSLISNLTSNFGGHMHVRYSGTTAYLDWYKYYTRDLGNNARPTVTVGKNILDISSESTADQIFTRVIPIGDTDTNGKTVYIDGYKYDGTHKYSGKAMPVSFIRNLYTDSQLTDEFHDYTDYRDAESKFGVIYKTMTFSNCDTQPKLWNEVKAWIKDSYFGIVTSFTIKAIDMHVLDGNYPKILIGECVDVKYPVNRNGTITWYTKKMVCKSISYDLFNPENNTYTFGIPSDVLEYNRHNRKKSSTKKTSSQVNAPAAVVPTRTEDTGWTWLNIYDLILARSNKDEDYSAAYDGTDPSDSYLNNGELSASATVYDPNEVIDDAGNTVGNNYSLYPKVMFKCNIVGKITLPGQSVKYVAYELNHGIFGYDIASYPKISHWYLKKKGTKYTPNADGYSTFERIAKMIETDNSTDFGGSINATSFRSFGEMTGSVRCYDPTKTNDPTRHPEEVFNADIIGKFHKSKNATLYYVAVSSEYGIFAYKKTVSQQYYPERVQHWYMRGSGISFDSNSPFFSEGGDPLSSDPSTQDKKVWLSGNGAVDGDRTIFFEPSALTGSGSQGEVRIGYKLSGDGDRWRIGLNMPIEYEDEDGNIQVADGFVSASDFKVSSIPSFKTKLSIVDYAIVGKLDAIELQAERAYINKLRGNEIVAGTVVRSEMIRGTTLRGDDFILNVTGSQENPDGASHLKDAIKSIRFYPGTGKDVGKIFYEITRMTDKKDMPDLNFNIADMQFFKDSVSAAKDEGASNVNIGSIIYTPKTGDECNVFLDPGKWAKAQGTYTDKNGQTVTTSSYKLIQSPKITIGAIKYTPKTSDTANLFLVPGDWAKAGGTYSDKNGQLQTIATKLIKTPEITLGVIKTSNDGSSATRTLSPGEWAKIGNTYVDKNGQTVVLGSYKWVQANTDSDLVAENIKKGVTIFGVAGSYNPSPSIVKDNLQVGSYNNVSTRPSADVEAETMHDTIIAAIKLCNWFRFRVYYKDTNVEKYYRMRFTTADKNAIIKSS